MTTLVGLVITAVMAFVIGMIVNRRKCLEHLVTERINVLRESEQRFDQLAEQSGTIVWEVDAEGLYTNVSHVAEAVLEYQTDEMVNRMHFYDLHPESSRDEFKNAALLIFKRKETFRNFENAMVTKTGRSVRVLTNGTPLLNADGSLRGYRGFDTDITERTQAVEEIKRRSALIDSLLDSIPDVIFFKDINGIYLGCNPPFAEFVGKAKYEIVGKTDYDLFPAEVADAFRDNDRRMLELREIRHNEEWITYPDGRKILIDTLKTPYWGPDGALIGVLGISRDITERKRAEAALRESEANFRTFFESMTDLIVVATPDGRILFTNAAGTRLLGYSAEEFKTMHVLDMHPADKRKEAEEIFTAMFKGERENCPLPLASKNGTLVPVETRVWLGRWNGAECVFGICKDLSKEQEAQQRFERLFRHNPAPMALSILPGRQFTDVNDAFLNILGYSRNDVIGKTAVELGLFLHPEQQIAVASKLQTDNRIFGFELQLRCKDGAIHDGLFSGEVISSQGRQYLLTVMIDITERKKAEESNRKSSEMVQLLMESTAEAIYGLDLNGLCSFANAACLRLLGYERTEELLGRNMHDLIHYNHADGVGYDVNDCPIFKAFTEEKEVHVDNEVLWRKDGTNFPAEYWSYPTRRAGKLIGAVVTFVDITARRGVEIQLNRHAQIEMLMAMTSMQFINLRPDETESRIHDALGAVGKLIGVDRVYVFSYTADLSECSNTYEWCVEGIEPQIANLQNVPSAVLPWWTEQMSAMRNIVIVNVSEMPPEAKAERDFLSAQRIQSLLVVPLSWGGRVEGFIGFDSVRQKKSWTREDITPLELLAGIVHNASKHKASELQLRELNATLEQRVADRTHELQAAEASMYLQEKLASIGQLAAGIAHELNNPIGFIQNNFSALKENVELIKELFTEYRVLAGEVQDVPQFAVRVKDLSRKAETFKIDFILDDLDSLFKDTKDGFKRTSSIINSMRDFSRTDQVGEGMSYDINDGIANTLVIAKNEYKYHCEVETDLGNIPEIVCDAGQINQVFLNLIVNAAHAISGQNRKDKGVIRIRTYEDRGYVCCEISDDGPGMPADVQSRIFVPFFTTKEPGKGTGLGLSISYDIIVKKHHGEIKVISPSAVFCADGTGKGTTFLIKLPVSRESSMGMDAAGKG